MAITNKCLDKWISEALSEDSLIQRYFMETTGKPLTGEVFRKSYIFELEKGNKAMKKYIVAFLLHQEYYLHALLDSRRYLVGTDVKKYFRS